MNPLDARRRLLGRNVYKKTVEGNPAIAQGSLSRLYPGITMQGWTEQKSYEGRNLLPVDVGQEFTGVVATDSATFEEDGVHAIYESIVSGEARDIYLYGDSNLSVESGYVEVPNLTPGNYRLVNDNIGILLYVVAWRNGSSVILGYANNVSTKITVQNGDKFRIFLRCNIIGDTNVKIHPMIVKEGYDTTVYEPYTGGQPSPSPDYPQPITSAGKYNEGTGKWEYEVKLTGANLFDISSLIRNGFWYDSAPVNSNIEDIISDSKDINLNIYKIRIKPNTDYTIKMHNPIPVRWAYAVCDMGGVVLQSNGNSSGLVQNSYSFTTLSNAAYIWLSIMDVTKENTLFQLEEGKTATAYQPYKEQTVTPTSDRPLTKWDRLEKRNGQWGWVYKSNHFELTGMEDFSLYRSTENTNKFVLYNIPTEIVSNYNTNNGHCNMLLYDMNSLSNEENGTYRIYTSNSTRWLAISIDKSYILDLFKDFLQEKYEEGNPFVFWYETAEETFVPLSSAEQEKMNALYTFRPTTVLSNDCDCNMTLTYKTKKSMGGVIF